MELWVCYGAYDCIFVMPSINVYENQQFYSAVLLIGLSGVDNNDGNKNGHQRSYIPSKAFYEKNISKIRNELHTFKGCSIICGIR